MTRREKSFFPPKAWATARIDRPGAGREGQSSKCGAAHRASSLDNRNLSSTKQGRIFHPSRVGAGSPAARTVTPAAAQPERAPPDGELVRAWQRPRKRPLLKQ